MRRKSQSPKAPTLNNRRSIECACEVAADLLRNPGTGAELLVTAEEIAALVCERFPDAAANFPGDAFAEQLKEFSEKYADKPYSYEGM